MNRKQLLVRITILLVAALAIFIGWTMANNAGPRGEFKARMEAEKAAQR